MATDAIPGKSSKICPRCGMEAHQFVETQLDRALGTTYFSHSWGNVMRVARERIQMLQRGFYKTDMKRGTTDKLDAYIPDR